MSTAIATVDRPVLESGKLSPLPVYTWQIRKQHRPRQYVLLTVPFSEARKMFQAQVYDFVKNTGEQRPALEAWVGTLRKRMERDEFAPAMWVACLRPVQRQNSEFHDDGTVSVHVGSKPIRLIDGNHRGQALLKDYFLAEKKKDVETMELIDRCDISVQIYLEPDRGRQSFQALQDGKRVSPDLLAAMESRNSDVPEKRIAFDAVMNLNANKDSHLYGRISTGGKPGAHMLGIKVATSDSSSESACSLYGGGSVANYFQKDAAWLEQRYIEAWEAIQNATSQDGEYMGRSMATVISPGRILCPVGQIGGRKGGTTLINGIANMWAVRAAYRGLDSMPKAERQHLADAVDQVFDLSNEGGLSAPLKRSLMRQFTVAYFEPYVYPEGDEHETGKLPATHGIPTLILEELMHPGAFGPAPQADQGEDDDD